MHFPALFLASILATQATSTPIAEQSPLALTDMKWTLSGLTRKRSNDSGATCKWRFKITDTTPSPSPSPSPSPFIPASAANLPSVRCSFKTSSKPGIDCGIEDFTPVKCSKSHPLYLVSGGHERFGGYFMVLVNNVDAGLRAYFVFDEALLESGAKFPPQTSPVQNDMVPPQVSLVEDED
ncbi:hypothetical protein F5B18DRAFT_18779 [Nemania serpens]|nr:hypothetical protein F5B18DRAFT_18779 [Nemania serpens]